MASCLQSPSQSQGENQRLQKDSYAYLFIVLVCARLGRIRPAVQIRIHLTYRMSVFLAYTRWRIFINWILSLCDSGKYKKSMCDYLEVPLMFRNPWKKRVIELEIQVRGLEDKIAILRDRIAPLRCASGVHEWRLINASIADENRPPYLRCIHCYAQPKERK